LHEEPEVPNFGLAHCGPILKSGMVLAIEPMVNMGTWEAQILDNGWTAVTKDRIEQFVTEKVKGYILTDKNFWNKIGAELNLTEEEVQHMRGGLKEAMRLEKEQRALLTMINDPSIMEQDKYRYRISSLDKLKDTSIKIERDSILDIDLTITNSGKVAWPNDTERKVTLGALWFNKDTSEKQYGKHVYEERCMLPFALYGGTTANINCKLCAKVAPGKYEVWFSPVHEQVTWFFQNGDDALKLDIEVTK